ncbi:hypothetical protein Bealeia1_00678 [Candidatus Bealeia paramacronuclearis]|uniref:DUF2059 domain-containing protein n=1 Tax=Candidatus Bealeia paramacronuclearis TaxID=1921001 RepID=A0ABZ2C1Y8_9PROT|nr:hypothetical protein [Candidatus Bealeia paramacronuclearis]
MTRKLSSLWTVTLLIMSPMFSIAATQLDQERVTSAYATFKKNVHAQYAVIDGYILEIEKDTLNMENVFAKATVARELPNIKNQLTHWKNNLNLQHNFMVKTDVENYVATQIKTWSGPGNLAQRIVNSCSDDSDFSQSVRTKSSAIVNLLIPEFKGELWKIAQRFLTDAEK